MVIPHHLNDPLKFLTKQDKNIILLLFFEREFKYFLLPHLILATLLEIYGSFNNWIHYFLYFPVHYHHS